jgi:hypothetical protein
MKGNFFRVEFLNVFKILILKTFRKHKKFLLKGNVVKVEIKVREAR